MPEEVSRVRRKRKSRSSKSRSIGSQKKPLIVVGAVVVALALALVALAYGPRIYNTWAETRLLKKANASFKSGELETATITARQILRLHPDSLPAFIILAEASEKQNRPETVAWRAQIARLEPRAYQNQLNLASAALRFGQLDVARRAVENVPPEARDRADYHVVAGWLARAQGNERELEEHFAAAVQQEPANELYQFNLAVLEIASPDERKRTSARATLDRLTKASPYRTGALRALLKDAVQRGDLTNAGDLAQDLQMSQQVTFADYLLCLDLYRKGDAKTFETLLEKVKAVATHNPADLALLLDWMNRQGRAEDVLTWTDKLPPELIARPPASIAVADAFAELKNWSRLKRWARGGSWSDAEYLRLAYQSYSVRQMRQAGADAEADALWRAAEKAANDEPEREAQLARLATKWSLTKDAEPLWQRVSRKASLRREALEALSRTYRAADDLPHLYQTLQRLHENSPGEAITTANFARLGLMLEQSTTDAQRLAKEAYDKDPTDPSCALTYAFSLYVIGRPHEAEEILRTLTPEQLHEPHAAVYAAVILTDSGKADVAKEYIAAARSGPLFLEEKKLLEEASSRAGGNLAPPASAVGSGGEVILPRLRATQPPEETPPPSESASVAPPWPEKSPPG